MGRYYHLIEYDTNVTKSIKQAAGSQPSDVAHQLLDHAGQQVAREQVLTELVSEKSHVFVKLLIFVPFTFPNYAPLIAFQL